MSERRKEVGEIPTSEANVSHVSKKPAFKVAVDKEMVI